MKKKKISRLLFFSIFLMFFFQVKLNSSGEEFFTGTNRLEKDIWFRLEVEDSIFVAYDSELDFGKILKGSKGKLEKRAIIKVEGGSDLTYVTAQFSEELETVENEWRKFSIEYHQEDKREDIFRKKDFKNLEEEEKIDVYLKNFEQKYELQKKDNGMTEGEIEVIGEIRNVENVRVGQYKGTVRVYITAITSDIKVKGE